MSDHGKVVHAEAVKCPIRPTEAQSTFPVMKLEAGYPFPKVF